MPFLSTGLTCTVICSNDATFSSGRTMTVPESACGSIFAESRVSATTDAYSVPWLPAMNATVLPGLSPRITATPIVVAASEPAGT